MSRARGPKAAGAVGSRFVLEPGLAAQAVASPRLNYLGRIGTDLSTIGTWDPGLSRRTRILVPIDVQAYVARADLSEPTVDVRGKPDDAPPFAAGSAKAPGVHLHWAMPDALLVGGHDDATRSLKIPDLPDAWVVVRTLQPVGSRQVIATGWVLDARTAVIMPLSAYVGPVTDLPPDAFVPLNGATAGLMWTASYPACENRFAFHDPLTDLDDIRASSAADGFAGDQAAYTVAGWWTDAAQDPLSGARAPAGLDAVLARLGWHIDHDIDDDDVAEPDPRIATLQSHLGLIRPVEAAAPQVIGNDGRKIGDSLTGVSAEAAYPVERASAVFFGQSLPSYDALLHGSVLGVPIGTGSLPTADDRPDASALALAIGSDADDLVAAFGARGLDLPNDARGLAEDVMAAFSMGAVTLLGSTDGLDAIADREQAAGFWAVPGSPIAASRPDRLRVEDTLAAGPMTVGRKGRAGLGGATGSTGPPAAGLGGRAEALTSLSWRPTFELMAATLGTGPGARPRVQDATARPAPVTDQARSVGRPPPRFYRPQPPMVALRGAHPSHRHHGDGLFDQTGKLLCRYPRSAIPSWDGLVDGATVLPSLGSGAIPAEVTAVVREAILLNPYAGDWLARAGAPSNDVLGAYKTRMSAEMIRLYGADGRYDGTTRLALDAPKGPNPKLATSPTWGQVIEEQTPAYRQITAELAKHSALRGLPPSPVALTTWRQPWVPLWLEWQVTLTGTGSMRGWHLQGYDVEPGPEPQGGDPVTTTLHGRSPIGQAVGEQIRAAMVDWLNAENRRAVSNSAEQYGSGAVVAELGNLNQPLDLVSASLDGIREQLLGIDFVGQVARGTDGKPVASGEPTVLFGGTLRVDALRLVDAFGRLLTPGDAVLDSATSTLELEDEQAPRTIRMRPRFQGSARWLLRLVDADQPPGTPYDALREAYVDQLEPASAPNPVAGFLMPDHIDESLESFTVGGDPLGEVGHDPITGAVTWDPAPGRSVRADAGPLVGITPQDRLVAEVAAGIVRADAAARALPPGQRPADSALVNLLRAIDTTLWTVDTFATVGSGTVAGLVGRPIAVVRASLQLNLPDDLDELTVTAPGGADARMARFAALGDEHVEVKLGTLTRSDDSLLGYFVDDDYEHLHLVDKVLAGNAKLSGRLVGQLGLLGQDITPPTTTLDHPYLVTDGVLAVQPRQIRMLTLLMLPMGKAHLTSGVLPRKELGLADAWFTAGMKKLMPSVRVGPLLVDPAEIRLPLVNLLGDKQTFSRRTGEVTWRDDPILAATQTAYLPRMPHEAQEGWIRVTPPDEQTVNRPAGTGTGTSTGSDSGTPAGGGS